MGLLGTLTKVAIILPLLMIAYDKYNEAGKHYTPTDLGITQPKISDKTKLDQKVKLIDPEKGTVNFSGWDTDIEDKITINWEDATPLSTSYKGLNKLKYKGGNFYILYTEHHVI